MTENLKIRFESELNKALDLFFYFDTIALFVFNNYCLTMD